MVQKSHRRNRSIWISAITGACVVSAFLAAAPNEMAQAASEAGKATQEPVTAGGQPGFRRLNEAQYKRSIEQIFGNGINVPGRFDPPLRESGLMAIGDGKVVVSASGLEQYELRA